MKIDIIKKNKECLIMDMRFLEETKMLNYRSVGIQNLINARKWRNLKNYYKIKSVYRYVQNEILFGYNCKDTLTAEQVLKLSLIHI